MKYVILLSVSITLNNSIKKYQMNQKSQIKEKSINSKYDIKPIHLENNKNYAEQEVNKPKTPYPYKYMKVI